MQTLQSFLLRASAAWSSGTDVSLGSQPDSRVSAPSTRTLPACTHLASICQVFLNLAEPEATLGSALCCLS